MPRGNNLLLIGALVVGGLLLTGNLGGAPANGALSGVFGGAGRSSPTNQGNQPAAGFQQGFFGPANGSGTGSTTLGANSFDEDIGVAPDPTQRGITSVPGSTFAGLFGGRTGDFNISGPGFTSEPVRVSPGGMISPVRQAIEAGTGRMSNRSTIDIRANAVNVHSRPRVVEVEPGTGRPSIRQ